MKHSLLCESLHLGPSPERRKSVFCLRLFLLSLVASCCVTLAGESLALAKGSCHRASREDLNQGLLSPCCSKYSQGTSPNSRNGRFNLNGQAHAQTKIRVSVRSTCLGSMGFGIRQTWDQIAGLGLTCWL